MCNECNGMYSNCPVCSEESPKIKCEQCQGRGTIFVDEDGELASEEFFKKNPEEISEITCDMCDGEGELVEELNTLCY